MNTQTQEPDNTYFNLGNTIGYSVYDTILSNGTFAVDFLTLFAEHNVIELVDQEQFVLGFKTALVRSFASSWVDVLTIFPLRDIMYFVSNVGFMLTSFSGYKMSNSGLEDKGNEHV